MEVKLKEMEIPDKSDGKYNFYKLTRYLKSFMIFESMRDWSAE